MKLYIDLVKGGEPPKPPKVAEPPKVDAVQPPGAEGAAGRPAEGGPDKSSLQRMSREKAEQGGYDIQAESKSGKTAYVTPGSGSGGEGGQEEDPEAANDQFLDEFMSKEEALEPQDPADVSDPLKDGSGKELGVEDSVQEQSSDDAPSLDDLKAQTEEGPKSQEPSSASEGGAKPEKKTLQEQFLQVRTEVRNDVFNREMESKYDPDVEPPPDFVGKMEPRSKPTETPEVAPGAELDRVKLGKLVDEISKQELRDELELARAYQELKEAVDNFDFEKQERNAENDALRAEVKQKMADLAARRKAEGIPPSLTEQEGYNESTASILSDLTGESISPDEISAVVDSDPWDDSDVEMDFTDTSDPFDLGESENFDPGGPDLSQEAQNRDTTGDDASSKPTTNYHRKSEKKLQNELTKHEILMRNKQRDHRAEREEHDSAQTKMQQKMDDLDSHIEQVKSEMVHPSTARSNRTNLERKKKEIQSLQEKLGQSDSKSGARARQLQSISEEQESFNSGWEKKNEQLSSQLEEHSKNEEKYSKEATANETSVAMATKQLEELNNTKKDLEAQIQEKSKTAKTPEDHQLVSYLENQLKNVDKQIPGKSDELDDRKEALKDSQTKLKEAQAGSKKTQSAIDKHTERKESKDAQYKLKSERIKREMKASSVGADENDKKIAQKIEKLNSEVGELQSAVDKHEEQTNKINDLKRSKDQTKRDKASQDKQFKARQKREMDDLRQEKDAIKSAMQAKKQGRAGILSARNRKTFKAGKGAGTAAASVGSGKGSGIGAVSEAAQAVAGAVGRGAKKVGGAAKDAAGSGIDYMKDKVGKTGTEANDKKQQKADKKAAAKAEKHDKAQAKKVPKVPNKTPGQVKNKQKDVKLAYDPNKGKFKRTKKSMGLYIDLQKAVGSKPNMAVNSDKDPEQVEEDHDTSFNQRTAGVNADASPDDPDVGKDWRGPVDKAVAELDEVTKSLNNLVSSKPQVRDVEINVLKSLGYEEEYIYSNYGRLKDRHYNEIRSILDIQVSTALTNLEKALNG